MTDQPNTRVLAAINSVQRTVSEVGIAKDRRNADQGFAYRGIDDVYNVVGPILANAGVFILPQGMERTVSPFKSSKGTEGQHAVVQGHYRWQHVEGEFLDIEAYGEATDYQHRAVAKAMSTAYKNMLFSVLCIPLDGADADDDQGGAPAVEPTAWQQLCAFIIEHGLEVEKVAKFAKAPSIQEIPAEKIPAVIAALTKRLEPTGTSVHRDVVASEKNLTPQDVAQERAHEIARANAESGGALALWQSTEREDSQLADVVWSLLPSNVRTAIRKAGVSASVQRPTLSQAYVAAYERISGTTNEDDLNTAIDDIMENAGLNSQELADITVYAQSREFPPA